MIIHDFHATTDCNALTLIQTLPFEFYLTGSRYLGTETPESDWDFFVEDSQELRSTLVKHFFVVDETSYPEDPTFVIVYKKDNVHVQVLQNAKVKAWVQYKMAGLMRTTTSKDYRAGLWRVGMALYYSGMDGPRVLPGLKHPYIK